MPRNMKRPKLQLVNYEVEEGRPYILYKKKQILNHFAI